jgi:hypothetical protein
MELVKILNVVIFEVLLVRFFNFLRSWFRFGFFLNWSWRLKRLNLDIAVLHVFRLDLRFPH